MRAVDEQPFGHGVQHQLFAGYVQFDADHQAEAADFFDEGVLARQIVEHDVQIAADPLDGGQQFVQDVAEFERHAAGQRSAAEGGAVHARLDGGGGLFVGHDHAERNAAGQRLGGDHDVGHGDVAGALVGEVGAGAAHAALGFVGDQEGVEAVGQFARLGDVLRGERVDAAFALDHFEHDGGGAVAEGGFERRRCR